MCMIPHIKYGSVKCIHSLTFTLGKLAFNWGYEGQHKHHFFYTATALNKFLYKGAEKDIYLPVHAGSTGLHS